MPIDYSKWKEIEVSDDEDDTHPNIDTPSLFRWRHRARLERQEEYEKKSAKVNAEVTAKRQEAANMRKLLSEKKLAADRETLHEKIQRLEKEALKAEQELKNEEDLRPWNVDTISSEGFSRTIVNKDKTLANDNLSDEERSEAMQKFVAANEDDMKKFGWLAKFEDSKAFMMERPHLACEHTANYLVLRCLDLAMEEKFAAMDQVAHQCIAIQYLLELAKQLDRDPRSCISQFFTKRVIFAIQVAEKAYKDAFDDELGAFKKRIRGRAKEKVAEQMRKLEEEERQARLGPGGLDPVEVFDSLPKELQECFESQDVTRLQETIAAMKIEDAKYHMKRCVASGLWNPASDDPSTSAEDGFRLATTSESAVEDACGRTDVENSLEESTSTD